MCFQKEIHTHDERCIFFIRFWFKMSIIRNVCQLRILGAGVLLLKYIYILFFPCVCVCVCFRREATERLFGRGCVSIAPGHSTE